MLGKKQRIILNYMLKNSPCSSWSVAKHTSMPESLVRYHLDKLVDEGILLKKDKMYAFVEEVFGHEGIIFIRTSRDQFIMVCPHYGNCDCKTDDCKFLDKFK